MTKSIRCTFQLPCHIFVFSPVPALLFYFTQNIDAQYKFIKLLLGNSDSSVNDYTSTDVKEHNHAILSYFDH